MLLRISGLAGKHHRSIGRAVLFVDSLRCPNDMAIGNPQVPGLHVLTVQPSHAPTLETRQLVLSIGWPGKGSTVRVG
jgi:hypothetical protein